MLPNLVLFWSSFGKSIQNSPSLDPPLGKFEPLESITSPVDSPFRYNKAPFLKNHGAEEG
uniref:Uncharacterized protein n=1 Tax=Nelumbo nucifera TaxID=4432 RepID=A0A822YIW7_NELNU|nr:TPA_asm: hypothetical protein HUJ06_030806 [Nelumbo nucifera]